ncbi:MAG TPA: arginine--tRNA ligase [Candidatus Eisenbacteria bacterium]
MTEGLAEALRATGLFAPERLARIELAIPRDPAHGDWTTNLPLILARETGRAPRAVAELLAAAFPRDAERFSSVEVAGPGFLNFRYSPAFLGWLPGRIRAEGETFGRSGGGEGQSIQVEYVSANPTGPLNVVSARAAAVGAALVRLLEATGHRTAGEFYVNDMGSQVDLLGESLAARFGERMGRPRPFPENGYQGAYLHELAAALPETEGRAALESPQALTWFRDQALERMVESQRRDLADYGVRLDLFFRESTLHHSGAVTETLEQLVQRGVVYEAESARWLKTTQFGDDKDRVVVRANGQPTYLLPDIAYHRDKRRRGFRHSIDLWGPDHHGHILPLRASLGALGLEPDFLEVLIVQQVNLLSGGAPVKMSKRSGEFITLRDLMEEVGTDCAKFFFLLRSTSAHLDFDLDLAKRQSDENPAYYVQYAHARIASILRFADERGLEPDPSGAPLDAPSRMEEAELRLVRKLAAFPEVVRGAAIAREPHRLPTYLMETAAEFHRFYHVCRVVSEDAVRSRHRLGLAEAARIVLSNGLALLGVSAPERMERGVEVGP